jgi:hypothetical protein
MDASFAEHYLASEVSWDSEPLLSDEQKDVLLTLADTGSGIFTYRSLGAAIFLGWRWKRAIAVETYADDEDKIFDHINLMLKEWAWAADSSLGGKPVGGMFAGGISKTDKDARNQNTDRVSPAFNVGAHQESSNPKVASWS